MDDARSLTAEKIDEGGDPSPRFAAYHNVLRKYAAVPEIPSIQPALNEHMARSSCVNRSACLTRLAS
jgi:hypothetical protein